MKKIAIISDIHSNMFGVEIFKKEIEKEKFDEYIFLGDYITDGDKTNEILEFVKFKSNNVILGNRENNILKLDKYINSNRWFPTMYAYKELSEENIEFLNTLNIYKEIIIESKKIIMSHGNPYDVAGTVNFENEETLDELIKDFNSDIYLFGHSHQMKYKEYRNRYFINSGAISRVNTDPCSITYGILYIDNKNIKYEQKIVKFDKEEYISYMINSKYFKENPVWGNICISSEILGINYYSLFIQHILSLEESDEYIESNWEDIYIKFAKENNLKYYV